MTTFEAPDREAAALDGDSTALDGDSTALSSDGTAPLLVVDGLEVSFGQGRSRVDAVRGVSFQLAAGSCLALVGESGSGKSVTARALVGLAGQGATVRARTMSFAGRDLLAVRGRQWRQIRGLGIGLVLQDALVSLDPLRQVGREIAEPLATHRLVARADTATRVAELMAAVGIPEPAVRARQYPHQLSGGLRQRALVAAALAGRPSLLVADEPTTALDVTVQARVLDLFAELKAQGQAMLLISHDLAVVSRIADHVAVVRDGEIVESGAASTVFASPRHPYTRALLAAVPSARTRGSRLAGAAEPMHVAEVAPAAGQPRAAAATVLSAVDVVKRFRSPDGSWRAAVDGVTFEVRHGEVVGLVGESGSGKSTLARIVLGLLEPDGGEVELAGLPWSPLPERDRRRRRGFVQAVFQDPLSSFDPRDDVGRVLAEALAVAGVARRERRDAAVAQLERVGLAAGHLRRRPRELSGGQRQRLALARALAASPRVLVCDEPVSALDVSVQAQVLDLLAGLRRELGLAMLFVSHDLGVVHHVADRVLVMKDGRVVESGEAGQVLTEPRHPYTRELVAAVPRLPVR